MWTLIFNKALKTNSLKWCKQIIEFLPDEKKAKNNRKTNQKYIKKQQLPLDMLESECRFTVRIFMMLVFYLFY